MPAAEPAVLRPAAKGVPLGRLVGSFGGELRSRGGSTAVDKDVLVTGLTLDSRRVVAGDLYAAVPGSTVHGARFAEVAVSTGAAAVLTDADGADMVGTDVPCWVVERPRQLLGALAAEVYGRPADRLTTIGVTGTHGKTTTCFLLEGGLAHSGTTPGLVGTVGTRIAGETVPSVLTTPEAPDLHALFGVMLERGVQVCAMEVSSHALVMGRVDGVVFDLAVFTNLGRDHLDFHADLEDYFQAKAQLFTRARARRALVNVDDPFGRRLLEQPDLPLRTFSPSGAEAHWRVADVELQADATRLVVLGPEGSRDPVRLAMPGRFNVANALAAVAALAELGIDSAAAARGVSGVTGVPGRMERVPNELGITVVVDYAHKPDAVAAVLAALRPVAAGRLIVVLGAGGDRDRGKRALMGEAAARAADVLVVTDDNPRSEDPARIRAALLDGAHLVPEPDRAEVVEVADRRSAIARAVGMARVGDCVLVAGKGHEQGQEVAGVVHPFDDRAVAREVLAAAAARGAR